VRSRVELVADVRDDGTPVLARMRAHGQLAVRQTGPGQVHLVGAAAGPLGGDLVEVHVLVRAGARLAVRGVAATLALPDAAGGTAESVLDLRVEDAARLDHALPPLVVCRGARLTTRTRLTVTGSGSVDLVEQVVLGRHGEDGGDWSGQLIADRDGVPLLRSSQRSASLRSAPLPARALVNRLLIGPDPRPAPGWHRNAVCCELAGGGTLLTSVGADLTRALQDAGELARPQPRP